MFPHTYFTRDACSPLIIHTGICSVASHVLLVMHACMLVSSISVKYVAVGYHTRISYRTRMVHTVCVYAYGTTIRVWYGYLYHMGIYYIFTVQLYSNTILFDICLRSILSPFNALCSFLPSDVLAQPALIKSVAG